MTDLDSAVHVPCTDVLVRVAKRVMQDEQDKTTRLSQLREAMHVKGYNTIDYGYEKDKRGHLLPTQPKPLVQLQERL